MSLSIRLAGRDDADAIGRLLYAFNREFDEPAPEPRVLAERIRQLLDGGDTLVLLVGWRYSASVRRSGALAWNATWPSCT
jgi:hypothetical protein